MNQLSPMPGSHHLVIPVPTIPLWAFTPVMQKAINYLQDGGKIPVELVVNVVLAAVSEACQSHIEIINPYTNMPEPCALYIVTLADSGTGKSTVYKQLRKPFDELKAELDEAFQEQLLAYKRDYAVWETKLQTLKSNLRMAVKKGLPADDAEAELAVYTSMEPVKPVVPTLVCNDPSESALIELLSKNQSITINSDEASNFFESCVKDNPVFFNKGWDGELYEHKRSNQAPRSFKPTLTLSLMLQRPLFLNFMKKNQDKLLNSGLLARFLFTNIPTKNFTNMSHRHHSNTSFRDETAIPLFHEQIKKLLKKQKQQIISGKTKKKTLKLSPEAAEFWENKRDIWISLPINDPRWHCIDYMLQKANTNTLRIAGLLHYFSDQETEIIPLSVVQSASLIMDWYLNQAVSWFYQFTDEYKFYQDVEELRQWIHNKFAANGWLPFKKNDIIKYGPNKFRRSDKLEPLMNYIIGQPGTGFFTTFRTSAHSAEYITWRMSNGFYAPLAAPPVQYLPQQAPKLINSSGIV
ncbi:MAG: DUF3987 domain-containing protein [Klebsiella pneumoniae]|uniref:DUF3987 domain-containing protein n=1 Tax=Klebsiella pneumoniae TaxID=573 RepID=UPI000E2DC369|nr:DUF3987 domain-containing protein [Klebsiella pneumoniae]MBZ7901784.1 DUF3987 domain-containing protein [Klebsiella pneumoniae]MDM9357456.1 DUF3987 domain-containing protein [Klebsiella pneumoniae]MDU6372043.1 DUF3987 domain-containing protein [Klebsiella pneumoniae]SXJ00649.1 Uncharacterised protein [Klebsiella pneumoniae]HBR2866335.1 DUF3987 domain-containing protein [Klebsiella pneumoniae]